MSEDTTRRNVKERVEAKYARQEREVDTDIDYAGQMTIAFCAVDDPATCWPCSTLQ